MPTPVLGCQMKTFVGFCKCNISSILMLLASESYHDCSFFVYISDGTKLIFMFR